MKASDVLGLITLLGWLSTRDTITIICRIGRLVRGLLHASSVLAVCMVDWSVVARLELSEILLSGLCVEVSSL